MAHNACPSAFRVREAHNARATVSTVVADHITIHDEDIYEYDVR